MKLINRIKKTLKCDDLEQFGILISEIESYEHKHNMIVSLLDQMAIHGSTAIFDSILNYNSIKAYIHVSRAARMKLFTLAIRHNKSAVTERLLKIPEVRDDIICDPNEIISIMIENHKTLASLSLVIIIPEFILNIENWGSFAWKTALKKKNRAAINKLLQFSYIFEMTTTENFKLSTREYIKAFLNDYFYNLEERQISLSPNFDVSDDEAKLCYLIIKYLLNVNSNAKSRFSKFIEYLITKFVPTQPLYLNRIETLLRLPAVRKIAAKDNNRLLKMAIDGYLKDAELMLGGVAAIIACEELELSEQRKIMLEGLDETKKITIEEKYQCPIQLELTVNPVRIKGHQQCYERAGLRGWVLQAGTDSLTNPLTRNVFTINDIKPASDIQKEIIMDIWQAKTNIMQFSVKKNSIDEKDSANSNKKTKKKAPEGNKQVVPRLL
jgi:hypothetical protein